MSTNPVAYGSHRTAAQKVGVDTGTAAPDRHGCRAAARHKVAAPVRSARDDVLAFTAVPRDHWCKIWSTNPLERLNKEVKRRGEVVGIRRRPAHGADARQLSHRRTFSANPITPRDSYTRIAVDAPALALCSIDVPVGCVASNTRIV
jgi:hypothetical protein